MGMVGGHEVVYCEVGGVVVRWVDVKWVVVRKVGGCGV